MTNFNYNENENIKIQIILNMNKKKFSDKITGSWQKIAFCKRTES